MTDTITLQFDTFKQVQIFFLLINNKKGLERTEISRRLCIPRTTIYDNLLILRNRYCNYYPYVLKYKLPTGKKGRPKVLWFIPKYIRRKFFNIEITPKIKVNETIINYTFDSPFSNP